MDEFECEVLIIGAGPAGLTAGIYCARANRNVIILKGKELPALERTKEIQNWPGEIDIKGKKLLQKFRDHVLSYSENVKIIEGDVISLMLGMGVNMTSTRTANITSDVVVIATGRGNRKEIIKGEGALLGYGVSYCALCDGPLYRERVVYLYGDDEETFEDALALHQMGCIVHVITKKSIEELHEIVHEANNHHDHHRHHNHNHHHRHHHHHHLGDAGIEIFDNMEVIEAVANQDGIIEKILCSSTKTEQDEPESLIEFELSCLFILSHISSNSIFKKAGIEIDDKGNVKVNKEQASNLKGVYAAGDVTGGLFQVVVATAEGAKAGINASKYLRQLKKK